MGSKAKERPVQPRGDRQACIICAPDGKVPYWKVWAGLYELNAAVTPEGNTDD